LPTFPRLGDLKISQPSPAPVVGNQTFTQFGARRRPLEYPHPFISSQRLPRVLPAPQNGASFLIRNVLFLSPQDASISAFSVPRRFLRRLTQSLFPRPRRLISPEIYALPHLLHQPQKPEPCAPSGSTIRVERQSFPPFSDHVCQAPQLPFPSFSDCRNLAPLFFDCLTLFCHTT